MLACAFTAAMLGIDGYLVRVEADSSPGTPGFALIGLPDRALSEARDRVRAAIFNSGFPFPAGRLLVNLAPADVRKEGPGFDLAIALGLLGIDEHVDRLALQSFVALGELALDGTVRPLSGLLPMTIAARAAGMTKLLVPRAQIAEALLLEGMEVYGVETLSDAVAVVRGTGAKFRRTLNDVPPAPPERERADLADVRGQRAAKRGLEVAAAGGHNLLLIGPPGCGKTMLARRLPSILPSLSPAEALDVTKIASVAGRLVPGSGIVRERPFRSPHHTLSPAALVGGGSIPKPGEITLATHGVLFLDELAEFTRGAIEALRQPIEEGVVTVARASGAFTYPARFALIAATNPCPCGYRGSRENDCRCTDDAVARYVAKLSGPLLDRIDLHVEVARLSFDEMHAATPEEPSAVVRARVEAARGRQHARLASHGITSNATIPGNLVRTLCPLTDDSAALLRNAAQRRRLSARALDRIIRVARTIADLAGSEHIERAHVAEAIGYRNIERMGALAAA